MSDLIGTNDRHEAREMGWHGKTDVIEDLNLKNCFLNEQEIIQVPLYFADGTPAIAAIDEEGNKFPWSILGFTDVQGLTVGDPFNPQTFKPFTNRELLDLVAESIKGTGYSVQSVLSCCDRAKIAISINLEQLKGFKVAGRAFEPYLNFILGRDKAFPLVVKTGNTCIVCHNTMQMALRNDKGEAVNARVKQTKKSRAAISNLLELIDSAVGVQRQFALAMEQFAAVP